MTLKFQPWDDSERRDALKLARRELHIWYYSYRLAKRQVTSKHSEVSIGAALNECKFNKKRLIETCNRIKEVSYDMQGMKPGEAG